jgi:5-hydroxyisourate hydrolase-like protein (transthyretin family)
MFRIASLILCTAIVAGLLITRTVLAAATPIKGIGVVIKKGEGANDRVSTARTNQDGKFTVSGVESGIYTISLKLDDASVKANSIDFSKFKTAVLTIEGVNGGSLIKRIPISELRRGVTLDIEVVGRRAGTVTGTCMATDESGRS